VIPRVQFCHDGRPASKVAPQIRQSVWSSSFSSFSRWAQIYGVTMEREGLALGATNGSGRDWSGSDADANPKSVAVEVARRSEKYEGAGGGHNPHRMHVDMKG
jgi:hypothetical protein